MGTFALLGLLTACDPGGGENRAASGQNEAQGAIQIFVGEGRDRLCLKPDGTAGLITFAATGDNNCSLRGTARQGSITPNGDGACTIRFDRSDDTITVQGGGAACAYYCGSGASLDGKRFTRREGAEASDLAGDPLC